ncbi:MAG: hypothetical protein MUC96_06435 [Myxococcaceae bacterium]|nr:hypothetical protein [Myxococcaceae bacterium]
MASRRRAKGPPASMTSERSRFGWWLGHAEAGDGEAMLEVATRFERGAGVEVNAGAALGWYRRAVHAGVAIAPALVGETVFEADPIAGITWLMLGFERAPDGDDANATIATSLSMHEPRLSDAAVQAAQVWADACRERAQWPDEVPAPHHVTAPFRPRPPTPSLPQRSPREAPQLTKPLSFGPWRVTLPPAAAIETMRVGQHLKATWGGAYALHLVWTNLAPGVDIDGYVQRSNTSTQRLWRPDAPPARFLLHGVDTTSCLYTGLGPSAGQRALKRFATRDERVAIVTAVAPVAAFGAKFELLEAVLDGVHLS